MKKIKMFKRFMIKGVELNLNELIMFINDVLIHRQKEY